MKYKEAMFLYYYIFLACFSVEKDIHVNILDFLMDILIYSQLSAVIQLTQSMFALVVTDAGHAAIQSYSRFSLSLHKTHLRSAAERVPV